MDRRDTPVEKLFDALAKRKIEIAQLEADQALLIAFVRADDRLADIEVRTHTDVEYKAALSALRASRAAISHLVGEGVEK